MEKLRKGQVLLEPFMACTGVRIHHLKDDPDRKEITLNGVITDFWLERVGPGKWLPWCGGERLSEEPDEMNYSVGIISSVITSTLWAFQQYPVTVVK